MTGLDTPPRPTRDWALPMLRFLRLPTRVPLRLPETQVSQKCLAALVIAALATFIAVAWRHTAVISAPMGAMDDLLYDQIYKLREPQDRTNGPVVIVAIDDNSIQDLEAGLLAGRKWPWPWPRELYGDMIGYFEKCGARVVAFDIFFETTDREADYGSDEALAEAAAEAKVPVIFGNQVTEDGRPGKFAIPVENPVFGAVNQPAGVVLREYHPLFNGFPSLALRAVMLYSGAEPEQRTEYLSHYYGPHRPAPGRTTFKYVKASAVLAVTVGEQPEADVGLGPEMFRDKIVLVGATAKQTFDNKATPLDDIYPGVEYQATAIDNMLRGDRVTTLHRVNSTAIAALATFLAALGVLLPRGVLLKVLAALLVTGAVVGLAVAMFRLDHILRLPLASPLVALGLATIGAFAWNYFTEDRQRRFLLKAFSQAVSPAVAERIAKDPKKINLGGERREMTVMFSDVAGFTDMSEKLEPERLAELMHFYLEQMSSVVLETNGTLDKYIGDAIMSFWNAPIDQPDHAVLACRTALGMARREKEIQEELRAFGATSLLTRIGLNTGPMAVGNLGSSRKFSYTVLGDSVNLGARLEGSNKLYGSQILIAKTTADLVKDHFVVRELDLLAVKGKLIPMAVYELMAEGPADGDLRPRVEVYGEGLAHYRAQRWDDAEATWTRLLREFPGDAPSAKMLARLPRLREEQLPPDWNGVYVAKDK